MFMSNKTILYKLELLLQTTEITQERLATYTWITDTLSYELRRTNLYSIILLTAASCVNGS